MLKKKKRVNSSLFGIILKKGYNYYYLNVSIKIIKTNEKETRFAVSVSKKEIKLAVKRNLLKRRVFSIIQKMKSEIKPGFNCVIFLKKGVLDISYQKLQEEIIILLKKAKVL